MRSNSRQHEVEEVTVSFETMDVNKIVIVVGTTGTGKSTIINMLFNNDFTKQACEEPCNVGSTADSVTKEPQWHFNSRDGKVYGDTIGLSDPDRSDLEIAKGLKSFIKMFNLGVHCIIIVAKFGRFSKEERCNLKIISEIFDSRWAKSCIMVLTHYAGETDTESQEIAIQNWLGEDGEINEFVSKIEKRIILTDNSLGRHEAANRPLREECLKKLNAFIDICESLVGPAPRDFLEILKYFLELYLSFYRINKAKRRVENVISYLQSKTLRTGLCPICFEVMVLSNMAMTGCHHIFHKDCIYEAVRGRALACPICRRAIKKLCVLDTNMLQVFG